MKQLSTDHIVSYTLERTEDEPQRDTAKSCLVACGNPPSPYPRDHIMRSVASPATHGRVNTSRSVTRGKMLGPGPISHAQMWCFFGWLQRPPHLYTLNQRTDRPLADPDDNKSGNRFFHPSCFTPWSLSRLKIARYFI
jgi:hypothetical protein